MHDSHQSLRSVASATFITRMGQSRGQTVRCTWGLLATARKEPDRLSQNIVTHATCGQLNFALPKSSQIRYLRIWNRLELGTSWNHGFLLCFLGRPSRRPDFGDEIDPPRVPSDSQRWSPAADPTRLARRTSGRSDSEWGPTNSRSARTSCRGANGDQWDREIGA